VDRSAFPGSELVEPGLRDLAAGVLSNEALLVLAAAPRLRRAGVDVPSGFDERGASARLYDRLCADVGVRAHGRHHALQRRVLSYAVARAREGRR
jgi:hypothetical protein